MKHGNWPYIHDKSLIQWIILFFVLGFKLLEYTYIGNNSLVYIHRKRFFIKYYRMSALPLLGWGKCKFHDNEHFTNHAIIWEFPFNLCKISFINNMTRMIEIIEHQASQNNYEAIFYSLWAIKISNTISKPKTSPKVPWQGATKMEISPRHHTATDSLEPKHISMICTYFGMWSIGLA